MPRRYRSEDLSCVSVTKRRDREWLQSYKRARVSQFSFVRFLFQT